jgi:hypothetical protein
MARALRAVLLWLMMLALPVQGFAAAAMAGCAPGHAGSGPLAADVGAAGHGTTAQRHVHHHTAAIGQAAGEGQVHHVMAVDVRDVPQQHGHAADTVAAGDQDSVAGHDMLKCCSVTCSMVALTDQATVIAPQAHAAAPLHPLASHYGGVTLAGPERPPKSILA